ncbi:hypothetical protein [Rhodoplanes roseus]|uniref:Uncharacterized protein n=1 Tax=Rhodoplanes roseus TaxID=29409 RepID=A0A327KZL5_9BRAD|nr:hypothetical protein [Rhodoplanes roseus]RAI43671.1 hypothetical protein CH341_13195 [Rhodoplanes roseus]
MNNAGFGLTPLDLFLGSAITLISIEAARRVLGLAIPIISSLYTFHGWANDTRKTTAGDERADASHVGDNRRRLEAEGSSLAGAILLQPDRVLGRGCLGRTDRSGRHRDCCSVRAAMP